MPRRVKVRECLAGQSFRRKRAVRFSKFRGLLPRSCGRLFGYRDVIGQTPRVSFESNHRNERDKDEGRQAGGKFLSPIQLNFPS